MNLISKILFLTALLNVFFFQAQIKKYQVKKITNEVLVTGKGTDSLWTKAAEMLDFSYPWRDETPSSTMFKALWSDSFFYFLFLVEDSEIISLQKGNGEKDLLYSDRVEIFFKQKNSIKPYYALEMGALGRYLDTKGIFSKSVNFNWNWPKEHFILKASQTKKGYVVEGSISLESLRLLGVYKDDKILYAGLYRGDYYTQHDKKIGVKWISWINPDIKSFHTPSSFGILKLIEQ